MAEQLSPGIPGEQTKESPFRFPELSDEQVVAVADKLGLYIKSRTYKKTDEIKAAVYGLQGRRVVKTKSNFITEVPDEPPATVFRRVFSFLEAEAAEGLRELDPETLSVSWVNPLQIHDTLADMVLGGWHCATVHYRERETTGHRVTLETRRVRNPRKYEEDVRSRLPDLIAERQKRAKALGEELRQAYESVVSGH